MNSDQIQKLISDLYTLTKKDKLDWQESVSEDKFIVTFPTFSVVIDQNVNFGTVYYYLDIFNDTGRSVESITIDNSGVTALFYEQTSELYELARRKALKADKTIADVLESLKEML